MYIQKATTISFQPTFGKSNFHSELEPLTKDSTIIHPDYTQLIPPMKLRRMTDVIKMSVGCAKACLSKETEANLGGIIVGTALGSSNHTWKFLEKVNQADGRLISPTSFILSTHNTMAGQISLALNCTEYNNTHSQNSLSFEHSLLDAILLIEEGRGNILIGTADETNEEMFSTNAKINSHLYPSTGGASFFLIDPEKSTTENVKIADVQPLHNFKDFSISIAQFLERNGVALNKISQVYYACYNPAYKKTIHSLFESEITQAYEEVTGSYLTASSFAVHLGYDFLMHTETAEYTLVINNILPKNLGLTLLKKE